MLDGKRLHGRFTLVRLKPRPGQRSRQDNWLLIKGHDEAEQRGRRCAGDRTAGAGAEASARAAQRRLRPKVRRRGKLPQRQAPQLASVADEPPEGDGWISEIKFDGYRLLCWLDHGKVRVVTRNGLDWTDRLPAVARAVGGLNAETALVDGELVALDKQGASSFPALQAALSAARTHTLYLYLFDLLHLDGWDLRRLHAAGAQARAVATSIDWQGMLRYSDHQIGDGRQDAARGVPHGPGRHRLQAGRCAVSRRPRPWLAEGEVPRPRGTRRAGLDATRRQPHRSRARCISAITIRQGGLHYAGGVGTGFSDDVAGAAERAPGENWPPIRRSR